MSTTPTLGACEDCRDCSPADAVCPNAGTVCVMGSSGDAAEAAIDRIRQAYQKAKGYLPQVFRDSSMGAERFGIVVLRLVVS